MTIDQESSAPVFEIDRPETYGQFLLTRPVEINSYLRALEKQHAIITIYVDGGRKFFISSILAVDEENGTIFLDLANSDEIRRLTESSPELTLTAILDKVTIQLRVSNQYAGTFNGRGALGIPQPAAMLRLQRREYFRLETPHAPPLQCKLARLREDNTTEVFNLSLLDISGGGVSLMAKIEQRDHFSPGSIFPDCRLEIPGDGFITVNLCVCKVSQQETRGGIPYLRIGCEFTSLPGTRLAQIQRYITRIERERKARESGLS